MAASGKKASASASLASNSRARREYHILDTIECGVELKGTEVKSIRAGKVSLKESFGAVQNGEVVLFNLRVEPYSHGNQFNHDPIRPKRLLLHRAEIIRIHAQVTRKGQTLVPLRLYLKRGRVKVALALARGKDVVDKRETLKRRTADREAQRAIAIHRRR